jgi:cytoskeleton protein RodZ
VDLADTDNAPPPKTVGQTLAAERERQGLSRADVAQRLHMSAYQVEALETGDYGRLPKGTFLRGFVRNYAKLLGLAPDIALTLLPDKPTRDTRPGIVVPTQNIRFDPIGDRLQSPYVKAAVIALVVLVVGFAVMYWWLFVKGKPQASAARVPVAEAPAAPPPAVQTPAPEPQRVAAAAMAALPAATPAPAPQKAAAEPKKAAAASDGNVIKFRFKGASWVEIRDAKGRILLSRLNSPGSEAEVAGKPPFNVVVGNAPEVQMFYNDQEFDLEPHTKVAVARFTVE